MIRLPPDIEATLVALLGLQHPGAPEPPLQKKIRSLSTRLYKLSREFAATRSGSGKYRDAYLAYNFPTNFMKSWMITQWIQSRFPRYFDGKTGIGVLDIGCGHGAGMFGIYYALKNTGTVSLTGIDGSSTVLTQCRKIASRMKKTHHLQVKLYRQQFQDALLVKTRKKFDVIVLANALAEIVPDEQIPQKYIEQITRHLTDDGIAIIIEPASRDLSRRLMRLRDAILQNNTCHILLPCLHENPCALISVRKDKEWCHQSREWLPPNYMRMLNKTLHREIDRLKFSYLVLSKKGYRERVATDFLVVSDMLKEKGRQRCFLCTPSGRIELVRLHRSKNPANQDFTSISRGDIISLHNIKRVKQNSWRIEETTTVTIVPQTA